MNAWSRAFKWPVDLPDLPLESSVPVFYKQEKAHFYCGFITS
jgi:hypothetical protein